jgi:hypothetical protein
VEDIDLWVDFVAKNSYKLQKLNLERKINWTLNVLIVGSMANATLVMMKHEICTPQT